jgi:hypothetical protein
MRDWLGNFQVTLVTMVTMVTLVILVQGQRSNSDK